MVAGEILASLRDKKDSCLPLLVIVAMMYGVGLSMPVTTKAPWKLPCGTDLITPSGDPPRHKFTKAVKTVRRQLEIAKGLFEKEKNNLNRIYQQVESVSEEEYSYNWLPQKRFPWFKTEIRCITNKTTRLQKVLPVLHSSLQNFSVTFEEMLKFGKTEVNTENVTEIRNEVIKETSKYLNQLLCEVESAIVMLRFQVPARASEDLVRSEKDKWNPQPDHTYSLIQDWGVISSYKNFLEEWMKIMSKVNKNSGCRESSSSSSGSASVEFLAARGKGKKKHKHPRKHPRH